MGYISIEDGILIDQNPELFKTVMHELMEESGGVYGPPGPTGVANNSRLLAAHMEAWADYHNRQAKALKEAAKRMRLILANKLNTMEEVW